MLVHPGGPFWKNKDEHAWSIAKGEYRGDENPLAAAEREFAEEMGVPAPPGDRIDLGEIRQGGGKIVRAWAVEAGDVDLEYVASNLFELEWPPRSGTIRQFPEVDRAEWTTVRLARIRLVKAQVSLLDRLIAVAGDR
jgi:predicted NUDIX family NTP pyrophosphohydrolase